MHNLTSMLKIEPIGAKSLVVLLECHQQMLGALYCNSAVCSLKEAGSRCDDLVCRTNYI